ncbi:hypothetical protein, partial [Streptococcus suis]
MKKKTGQVQAHPLATSQVAQSFSHFYHIHISQAFEAMASSLPNPTFFPLPSMDAFCFTHHLSHSSLLTLLYL